jgi:hypothetical protein
MRNGKKSPEIHRCGKSCAKPLQARITLGFLLEGLVYLGASTSGSLSDSRTNLKKTLIASWLAISPAAPPPIPSATNMA